MILRMIRYFVMPLLMVAAISAQTTQVPKLRIVVPERHLEKASMTYGLHDPGKDLWELHDRLSQPPGPFLFEISAETDRFKALVWASGCQMKRFDVPVEKSDIELRFTCNPLKTVPFKGRASGIDVGDSARISVSYLTLETLFWFYDSKPLVGSSVAPAIHEIATAPVSADGSLTIQLPDLGDDPIASRDSWATLEFRIIGAKGQHLLEPQATKEDGTRGGQIKVGPSYPAEVRFR